MNGCCTTENGWKMVPLGMNVDRLFRQALGEPGVSYRAYPPIDVSESDAGYRIEADLPGFALADVDVSVHGAEVTIAGKRASHEIEGAATLRRERPEGEFSRTLRFTKEIDPAGVTAKLDAGVLVVELPKAAAARPRKVVVAAAG
ncbi:MAG: Hsp20/alpha crystallin family protein [Phycisphaerae bacterium]|nr:Hsp20/alpha crystallin family protein [Phycisphaerae bacterium]